MAGQTQGEKIDELSRIVHNLVARIDPASLPALGEAIGHVDPSLPSIGLAFALADLARLRHQMLIELETP